MDAEDKLFAKSCTKIMTLLARSHLTLDWFGASRHQASPVYHPYTILESAILMPSGAEAVCRLNFLVIVFIDEAEAVSVYFIHSTNDVPHFIHLPMLHIRHARKHSCLLHLQFFTYGVGDRRQGLWPNIHFSGDGDIKLDVANIKQWGHQVGCCK